MIDITPLILTFNEAPNIRRTLERLSWAREILVVDSFSTDETLAIVQSFPRARVLQRHFDSFARQCNFGLEQIASPWVLSLDADYVLSEPLVDELASLSPPADVVAFDARFTYCVAGRPLRASLYPTRTVLYRRDSARYHDDGHGHRVQIHGQSGLLRSVIHHDDRKSLGRWLQDQGRYAELEASKLESIEPSCLTWPDRIRRQLITAPILVFFYLLLWRGLILDGWPGWVYVCQRLIAELILSARLAESRLAERRRSI